MYIYKCMYIRFLDYRLYCFCFTIRVNSDGFSYL